jgi:hypothetical protein
MGVGPGGHGSGGREAGDPVGAILHCAWLAALFFCTRALAARMQ